jgi:hypothetical protein
MRRGDRFICRIEEVRWLALLYVKIVEAYLGVEDGLGLAAV